MPSSLCFIPGNSAKARSLGLAVEQCITLGTMGGGGTKPAVLQPMPKSLAWNIQTCDGGSHRRKDRINGGMYITPADISLTLSAVNPTTQCVIVHQAQIDSNRP